MTQKTEKTNKATKRKKSPVVTSTKAKGAFVKIKAIKEKQTRIEILQSLSDSTGLKRVDVEAVFTELAHLVKAHMKKSGSGEVIIPKLGVKIKKIRRKATKKRTMVSPLTKQEVTIPSKPARDDVKLIALKGLKESLFD